MELGKGLRIELHCHNKFSNYMLTDSRFGLDCEVGIPDQLYAAKRAGLDGFFIMNHNTLDGYKQLTEYQKDYPYSRGIKVFQGAEYSVKMPNNKNPHVGALGISEPIKPYQSLDEILEDIRKQGGLSVAEHPFAVTGVGVMNDARKCDVIEGFNSNNYDLFSNIRAQIHALENGKYVVPGSDSHLIRTLGKSTITAYPRDKHPDDVSGSDVTEAIKMGNFVVNKVSYNTIDDFKDMTIYHFSERDKIMKDLRNRYPWPFVDISESIYKSFEKKPNRRWVDYLGSIFLQRLMNLSKKVNMYGYDDRLIHKSSIWRKIIESSLPTVAFRCNGGSKKFEWAKNYLKNYNFEHPEAQMNAQNKLLRGGEIQMGRSLDKLQDAPIGI